MHLCAHIQGRAQASPSRPDGGDETRAQQGDHAAESSEKHEADHSNSSNNNEKQKKLPARTAHCTSHSPRSVNPSRTCTPTLDNARLGSISCSNA